MQITGVYMECIKDWSLDEVALRKWAWHIQWTTKMPRIQIFESAYQTSDSKEAELFLGLLLGIRKWD